MLYALKRHAEAQGWVSEPGFRPKIVRWLLSFSRKGEFLGIVAGGPEGSKGREFPRCPDLSQPEIKAGGAGCRHFLVDSADVVTLLTKEGEPDAKLRAKHNYFVGLLERASGADPDLAAVVKALRREAVLSSIRIKLAEAKVGPTDQISLAVLDTDKPVLVERDTWHDWWRSFRSELTARRTGKSRRRQRATGGQMRCLLSGKMVTPAQTHKKITGLVDVGGLAMGDVLSPFKQPSTCSFGLEQAANSAMSEEMAEVYRATLNRLIADNSRKLAGAKVVYWYIGDVPPQDDPMPCLFGANAFGGSEVHDERGDSSVGSSTRNRLQAETRVAELLDAIRTGRRPDLLQARYCALTLSANSGRVVIRDWMEGQFEELVENIESWLHDLTLANLAGTSLCRHPGLERLLTSLLNERKRDQDYSSWIAPVAAHRNAIWLGAIRGDDQCLPQALAERACRQQMTAVVTHEFPASEGDLSESEKRQEALRLSAWYARLGLMKAFLLRRSRVYPKENIPMTAYLDVDHPRASYQCGRLMAVLQMIQRKAQGDVGTTIAQSHYASASTRPITALPRLETLTQHHLPKIEPMTLRAEFQRLLTEIQGRIKGSIPRTFDLEDQCLFHLGYYQQLAYQPYEEPPHRHKTLRGDRVRSKSEVVLANLLTSLGVQYEYEAPLVIGQGDNTRTIHPDFTIRQTKDGRPIYVEHLGMMDNFTYRSDWNERLALFGRAGIALIEDGGGPNGVLITTTEDRGSIDCEAIKDRLQPVIDEQSTN